MNQNFCLPVANMVVRQTNNNRFQNSGSFPSAKVVPISSDVPIHGSGTDDEKVCRVFDKIKP